MSEVKQQVHGRLRRQFATRRFLEDYYRPPTGIGLFRFEYTPQARLIDITVRVNYEFQSAGQGTGFIDWTEPEKALFRRDAKAAIRRAWSQQYRFVCTDPDWSDLTAAVNVAIEEAPRDKAHYIVKVRKTGREHGDAWKGGCEHGSSVWPYIANFSNWGVVARREFGGDHIFNFKHSLVRERLVLRDAAVLPMQHGSAALDAAAQQKIASFAADAKRVLGSDVTGIYCNVVGFSTEMLVSRRATERAGTVVRTGGATLSNFFKASTSSTDKKLAAEALRAKGINPDKFSGAVLLVDVPSTTTRMVPTNYIILTHEFGHMLGCPDEYTGIFCTGIRELMKLDEIIPAALTPSPKNVVAPGAGRHFSAETKAPNAVANQERYQHQQGNFANLIQQAGVASPVFAPQGFGANALEADASAKEMQAERDRLAKQYGRGSDKYKKLSPSSAKIAGEIGATDSIMFTGQKVFPAHYLPIWACLVSMTREFVDPSDWKIENA